MKIGELAQQTRCKVETIRFYEQKGLLPEPERTEGRFRNYGAPHVERLSFIRNCRHLDMSHTEIRILLHYLDSPKENCARVNSTLDEHRDRVSRRILELQDLERQLVALRERCDNEKAAQDCGILQELCQKGAPPRP